MNLVPRRLNCPSLLAIKPSLVLIQINPTGACLTFQRPTGRPTCYKTCISTSISSYLLNPGMAGIDHDAASHTNLHHPTSALHFPQAKLPPAKEPCRLHHVTSAQVVHPDVTYLSVVYASV